MGLGGCARAGRRQAWEVVALLRVSEWQLLEGMMRRMDMMDAKIDSVAETFQVAPRRVARQLNHAQRSGSTGRLE